MRRHHYHAPHAMRLGLCGRLWRLGGFRYVLYTPFCGAQRPASPWPFREVRTSRSYSRRAGATRSPLPASWNKCNPAGRNDGWAGVSAQHPPGRRHRCDGLLALTHPPERVLKCVKASMFHSTQSSFRLMPTSHNPTDSDDSDTGRHLPDGLRPVSILANKSNVILGVHRVVAVRGRQ